MTGERHTAGLEDDITHAPPRAQALEAGEKSRSLGGTVEERVTIHPKDRREILISGKNGGRKEGSSSEVRIRKKQR